jgi:hypothetical protein
MRISLITRRIGDTLSLMDVRVLDHLIIGEAREYAFAEPGFCIPVLSPATSDMSIAGLFGAGFREV